MQYSTRCWVRARTVDTCAPIVVPGPIVVRTEPPFDKCIRLPMCALMIGSIGKTLRSVVISRHLVSFAWLPGSAPLAFSLIAVRNCTEVTFAAVTICLILGYFHFGVAIGRQFNYQFIDWSDG